MVMTRFSGLRDSDSAVITSLGVVGLFGRLFIGRYFGRLATGCAIILYLVPLLRRITEMPQMRRRSPWVLGVLRLFLIAIPLADPNRGVKQHLLFWMVPNGTHNHPLTRRGRLDVLFNCVAAYPEFTTHEFSGLCRDRLHPDGLNLYNMNPHLTPEGFRRIVTAFTGASLVPATGSAGCRPYCG